MAGTTHTLAPYVPRVLAEWDLEAPGSTWQRVEGSLCFVDISGFTNLSEKLARRGRIGAEELTDVLDRVFGNMLSLAYRRGGELLKFGGDALLLLFQGDDHTPQAVSAAIEMRRALRDAARVATSVGRISLRMSVGIHTGGIDLFRVGGSHRELIITGAASTVTTEMEATADAGQIVISDAVCDVLPSDASGERKGAGWLLRWIQPRVEPRGPILRERIDDYHTCIPAGLREYLDGGEIEPEHRIATVGFVRFKGVQAVWDGEGPEAVGAGLDRLLVSIQEAVDGEGVTFLSTDIDADGGKVVLVSGVPSAQEDDEGRMLRAARKIADSKPPFPCAIGLSRGHVFSGEIGTEFRSTFTVMGDTVNLAARLMAAAKPGAVFVSPAVLDRSRTLFATTRLDPFRVKGKAEPVHVYALGAETGVRSKHSVDVLPFSGRREELTRLSRGITDLTRGTGGVITVVGDTGIGKSRLVEEAVSGFGGEVFTIRAEPNSTGNPYWAFRDPLRRRLDIERRSQKEMTGDLETVLGAVGVPDDLPLIGTIAHIDVPDNAATSQIQPQFRPDRTADALLRLFARLFELPIVVRVEDGQWLDDASLQLIRRLAAGTMRLAVVVTAREDEPSRYGGGETIRLGPLTSVAARAAAIEATAAAPLHPSQLDNLISHAGGNPLFLGEIVRAVRVSGSVDDLPESLDAVVGVEIDALAGLPRRVLRAASVLGRSFRQVVLDEILKGEGIAVDVATTRALTRFLEEDGTTRWRFRHTAVHRAAYEGLSFRRRRDLHARAGDVIERLAGQDPEAVAEFLAMHFSESHQYEKAWRYAVVAADRAKARYANVEAAAQYRIAIDAARKLSSIDGDELRRVHEALGDVYELTSLYDDAALAFDGARRVARGEAATTGRLMAKQGLLREKAGKLSAALKWFRRGLNALEGSESDARAELLIAYGGIRFRQGRFTDAIRWCSEALDDPGATDAQLGHALYLLVTIYAHLGMSEAADAGLRAIEIFERTGDLIGMGNVLNNLGVDAYYRGEWADALDLYTRSGDARRRAGDVVGAAASVNNVAEILSDQGHAEEAIDGFRQALYVWESSNFSVGVALASINLGRALTRSGRFDEAARSLGKGLRLFSEMGAESYVLETRLRMAELELARGEPNSAAAMADEVLSAVPADPSTLMLRAGLHRVVGQSNLAELRTSLACAEEANSLFEVALTLETLTRLDSTADEIPTWTGRLADARERLGIVAIPTVVTVS